MAEILNIWNSSLNCPNASAGKVCPTKWPSLAYNAISAIHADGSKIHWSRYMKFGRIAGKDVLEPAEDA